MIILYYDNIIYFGDNLDNKVGSYSLIMVLRDRYQFKFSRKQFIFTRKKCSHINFSADDFPIIYSAE